MPKDFRTYLDELLEKRPKDVVVVDKEVDPRYEASGIVEKFERKNEFPLVFFKNIKGSKIPLVINLGATYERLAALKDPNNVLSKRSIYYDLDKFDVKDEYRSLVEAHAKYLRENPSARMMIQGNTDERGSREYNVGLGQRRSDGVKRMMILLGARENQIESVSLGEEKPQADGHDEGAWSKNRRSDMLYGGEY